MPLDFPICPYAHLSSKVILRGTHSFCHSDLGKFTADIVISRGIYGCIWTFSESARMASWNRGRFEMRFLKGAADSTNKKDQRQGCNSRSFALPNCTPHFGPGHKYSSEVVQRKTTQQSELAPCRQITLSQLQVQSCAG